MMEGVNDKLYHERIREWFCELKSYSVINTLMPRVSFLGLPYSSTMTALQIWYVSEPHATTLRGHVSKQK